MGTSTDCGAECTGRWDVCAWGDGNDGLGIRGIGAAGVVWVVGAVRATGVVGAAGATCAGGFGCETVTGLGAGSAALPPGGG